MKQSLKFSELSNSVETFYMLDRCTLITLPYIQHWTDNSAINISEHNTFYERTLSLQSINLLCKLLTSLHIPLKDVFLT